MSMESIGNIIAKLRKEKGATQEELAKHTQVSTQAVSKWENGGVPDIELLPKIADFFGVSIDALFGRNVGDYSDLKTELTKHISALEQEQKMEEAMELCWIIEKALGGARTIERTLKEELDLNGNNYFHSQMLFKSGISSFSLVKDMPYFIITPRPESGWKKGLFKKEEYQKIFNLLGNSDVMDTLFMLCERENKQFTPKLLETKLNIPSEKATQILNDLKLYGLIHESEIELDDSVQKVYGFKENPAIIFLFAIAKEIIKRPNAFTHFCSGGDHEPYLL